MSPKPVRLQDDDALERFVTDHEVALVELYTSGCPKCQAMEPVLGNVGRSTTIPVGLAKLGDDPVLLERFDVQSVPTLVLFREGEQVARVSEGFLGGDEVVDFVEDHAPGAVPEDA
ncbi:thioredoxin family protein [Natronobacterium gregoryi]|uniref:Thioredoxin n=2 Tax=Natronobacterium gregoryi TaxID=44930 RepID=L0AKH7_NATGS|nr:thioredoxin family protein [Natronobacterium gregoryi]AFZ74403.1 thioredoxin domain-containing protein [Natronobacterium gregoryi SP2]ELY72137.1 thioredoxin [Natronobacterium gregoryi SP2]PLK19734.1 thioredoxin [Natronobacterium gregoryi SP2]SFJ40282.1 Thioredoxin [Natronobacterium gregoryi]